MNVQVLDAQFKHFMEDAPVCDQCGAITVRNGACYRCYNCGNSHGLLVKALARHSGAGYVNRCSPGCSGGGMADTHV